MGWKDARGRGQVAEPRSLGRAAVVGQAAAGICEGSVSYLFAPREMEMLADFARSNVLLAFDYDGTLAPIVDHPRDAVMRPETKALLRQVTRLYPCTVISGRSRADVRQRLSGTGV